MKTATTTQAKNGLSALLRDVQRGETVLILSRGKPIARLQPVDNSDLSDDAGRVARLTAAGILLPPRDPRPNPLLDEPPPSVSDSAGLLAALLQERSEAR
jgi:prevent-host-death family protein